MQRVINFSGGQSSAMMALLEYNKDTDYVIFADTGREHESTYQFIDDFVKHEGIPILKLSYQNEFGKGFTAYNRLKKTILPNRRFRRCTVDLKIRTTTRYIRNVLGIKQMDWLIGFRADEPKRVLNYDPQVKYKHPKFPLYERGLNLKDVNDFWLNKNYRLNIPRILGNCNLCFLKGKNNIIQILKNNPEFADEWIEDEKRSGRTYFKDINYETLLLLSKQTQFKLPLSELQPSYNCLCTT